jgi:hypothetical protein
MVLRSISSSRAWKIAPWDALIVEAARLFGSVRVENPLR